MSTPYQPMQGAWYRVVTLGGEVIEKMQYRDGAFHGIKPRTSPARVIPMAEIERVAVRYRPGVAGGGDRFHVINETLLPAPTKRPYGTLRAAVKRIMRECPGLTVAQITARLPAELSHSNIRQTLGNMKAADAATSVDAARQRLWYLSNPSDAGRAAGHNDRLLVDGGCYRVLLLTGRVIERTYFCKKSLVFKARNEAYGVDVVERVAFLPEHAAFKLGPKSTERYSRPFVSIDDCVLTMPKEKPAANTWVHPIRRRLLGLPVAQAPSVEPDTDYAHPTRKSA